MPAATSAICSGVAATLYCPTADWAAKAGDFRSASVGSRLGTSLMSSGGASPKPKSLAVLASAPGGSWVASLAKYTLRGGVGAWVMPPPQTSLPKFLIGMLVWAGRNCPAGG